MNNFYNNESTKLVTQFDENRSLFTNEDRERLSAETMLYNFMGFIIFSIIFLIAIPYILYKYKHFVLLTAYMCNVDMIATVLGFAGGPHNMWKYLYNPANVSDYGFASTTAINYIALLSVGFAALKYSAENSTMFRGISHLLIIYPVTYLLPGNFIVYLMNRFAKSLSPNEFTKNARYLITLTLGLVIVSGIILLEKGIIELLAPNFAKSIKNLLKHRLK